MNHSDHPSLKSAGRPGEKPRMIRSTSKSGCRPNILAAVRLRTADCVFDYAMRAIEDEDIEMRVAELEQAVKHAMPMGTSRLELVS